MQRSSFGTRARQRIWRDTFTSVKGRVIAFIIGAVGIVIGFLTNFFWLHLTTAKQLAILSAISLGGSYAVWFVGAVIINALRVPWLLDAESTDLINTQEARAEDAEKKITELKAARDKHDLFGRLMQQGVGFSRDIRNSHTEADFASWDRHFGDWLKSVQQEMQDMGFFTDAVEFARSGTYADPMKGVVDTRNNQAFRMRVLEKHQENLADFVRRRLPFS